MEISLLYEKDFINFLKKYRQAIPSKVLIENMLTPCREFKEKWYTDYLFFDIRRGVTVDHILCISCYTYTKHIHDKHIYFLKSSVTFIFKKEFERLNL